MNHLFGEVVNEEMILNEMGQIAFNEWLKTSKIRPNVSLDVFEIMPNHMHGIIIINEDEISTGESYSPNNDTEELNSPAPMPGSPFRSPANNIGAIVRGYKSSVTKQINLLNYDGSAWHRNYYEPIIRNEQSYQRISDYIINNAKSWRTDKFYTK